MSYPPQSTLPRLNSLLAAVELKASSDGRNIFITDPQGIVVLAFDELSNLYKGLEKAGYAKNVYVAVEECLGYAYNELQSLRDKQQRAQKSQKRKVKKHDRLVPLHGPIPPYPHAKRFAVTDKKSYRKYLKSDWWQARRQRALALANRRCRACGGEDNLGVHHVTYKRLWEELDTDLEVRCWPCHEKGAGVITAGPRGDE
jgi:hypothetical protein